MSHSFWPNLLNETPKQHMLFFPNLRKNRPDNYAVEEPNLKFASFSVPDSMEHDASGTMFTQGYDGEGVNTIYIYRLSCNVSVCFPSDRGRVGLRMPTSVFPPSFLCSMNSHFKPRI